MYLLGMHSAACYGKWDEGVERQIGAYFSLIASAPEVHFWLWFNSARIGVGAMPHTPPAIGSVTEQGPQLLLFKIHHAVCARAMPSMGSSQLMMVQQGYRGRHLTHKKRLSPRVLLVIIQYFVYSLLSSSSMEAVVQIEQMWNRLSQAPQRPQREAEPPKQAIPDQPTCRPADVNELWGCARWHYRDNS